MLVCNKCGTLIDDKELDYVTEMHGERHLNTACRCGGDFIPATQCKICGVWFDNSGLYGICEGCLEEYETVGTALEIGDANREDVEINSFVASVLSADRINHILEKWVEENYTDHSSDVRRFLNRDLGVFSEHIENKE
jgi:hypothetical protein